MVQCGICIAKEKFILGELWLKSPNCGNHCKTWIQRFKEQKIQLQDEVKHE